jgi:methylated-DNA-protein-cysteine methyltransferase-like protein
VSHTYAAIWAVARRIPRGRVATYGQIAALAGFPRQPRLAGYAMHGLPDDSRVPWHRVVNAQGKISPRSGGLLGGGESVQRAMLEREKVRFDRQGRIDLARYQWRPRTRRKQEER